MARDSFCASGASAEVNHRRGVMVRVSDHKDLKMPAVLSRVGPCASWSPVAMNEMFELFDNELLITDNAFHHVANRNYTNQSFTLEHREMAHCFGGHHSHTFLD